MYSSGVDLYCGQLKSLISFCVVASEWLDIWQVDEGHLYKPAPTLNYNSVEHLYPACALMAPG